MERFEQVQILHCLIQLSFHYFASSHRKKKRITSENSNKFEEIQISSIDINIDEFFFDPRKKLRIIIINEKFSSFRLTGMDKFL